MGRPVGSDTGLSRYVHKTVLRNEAVSSLEPKNGGKYVDCTLGGAGHTALLLSLSEPTGSVLAIDQDLAAHENARVRFSGDLHRLTLVESNFRHLRRIASDAGFAPCDGILFDLGVSSVQFDEPERGFSYRFDAPLDMRMDARQATSAKTLVNTLTDAQLSRIFFEYGEEKFSRRIASAIVSRRVSKPFESTGELADVVKEAIPAPARRTGPHPARRVFQALRIAVNDELGALTEALDASLDILGPGARVAVISFHSLEDRIVKKTFAKWAEGCICPPDFPVCRCGRVPEGKVVTRKPIVANQQEVEENPRARSAKLRVFEKTL